MGDTMADDVVAARAYGRGEPLVPKLARRSTETCGVLAHPPVDLGRRDPSPEPVSNKGERGSGGGARLAHAGDLAGTEDLDGHGPHEWPKESAASNAVWTSPAIRMRGDGAPSYAGAREPRPDRILRRRCRG